MGYSMRMILMLACMAFAGGTARLALPAELNGETAPHFFALAGNNIDEIYRDDMKEAAKKAGAKRVVLSFFATWCVSCREEFAILRKNKDELARRGVMVYLINTGESLHDSGGKAAGMANEYAGDSFQLYFDPGGSIPRKLGLSKPGGDLSLPMALIMDSNMKALGILTGKAGDDFPQVLWGDL